MRAPSGAGLEPRARGLTSRTAQGPAGCREPTTSREDTAMVRALLADTGTSTPPFWKDRTMPPSEQPPNVERLDWRLTELESKVDRGFAQMRSDMRDQLTRLEGTVERMAFVDVKLYQSEQRAQDKQISDVAKLIADVEKRMNDRIDDTEGRQHWTLGLLVSAIVVALAGGLIRLALG